MKEGRLMPSRVLDFTDYAGDDAPITSSSRVRTHDTVRDLESSYAEVLYCLVRRDPSSDSGYLPRTNGSRDRLDIGPIRSHRIHCWADGRGKTFPTCKYQAPLEGSASKR